MTVEETVYDPEICENAKKISWSKHGFIAYANPDHLSQNNLCITYMECVDGINWQLAPLKEFPIRSIQQMQEINNQVAANNSNFKIPPPSPISLLSYGPNCADLAIADNKGNLTIVVTGVLKPTEPSRIPLLLASLNELEVIYNDQPSSINTQTDDTDESSKIIAFQWLPLDKPLIVNGPATRISTASTPLHNGAASEFGAAFEDSMQQLYQYNVAQHKPVGPSHPIGSKQACIGVKRNGEIALWYQGEHGLDYFKVSNFLEPEIKTNISKLSIGFTRDGKVVVLVFCALASTLKLYTISIDWGYLTYASQMQKKMPNFVTSENNKNLPIFKIDKLLREKFQKIDLQTGEPQVLKILELISPNHLSTTELEVILGFETKQNDKLVTCLKILRIDADHIQKLFGNDNNLSQTNSIYSGTAFKTREVIRCSDLLLSIKTSGYGSLIILNHQNGKVEVLDRNSLELISTQFDHKLENMSFNNPASALDQNNLELPFSVRSLLDAGFKFPSSKFNPLFIAISPNLSSYVVMDPHSKTLTWRTLERELDSMVLLQVDSKQDKFKKGFLILTLSAFAYNHTSACFNQSFTGDLITAMQLEIQRVKETLGDEYLDKLILAILEECQRSINFQLDYTRENADKLLNHPPFQKLLSLQLSLGTSMNWQRNKSSKIAFYLLNLRLGSLIITLSLRTIFHQIQKESSSRSNNLDETYIKSNTLISTIGFVRWFVDFCILLNQELIEIGGELAKAPQDRDAIIDKYIVIPLLLNTVSRSLLLYFIAGIKKLNEYSTKSVENIDFKVFKNLPILESFERLNSIIKSSPIKLDVFEKFIIDTDSSIRTMKHDKPTSMKVETQLFCQGKVPTMYLDPITKLCALYTAMVKKDSDLYELYIYDFDWLNPNKSMISDTTLQKSQVKIIVETSDLNHDMILKFKKKKNSLYVDELRKNLIISRHLRRCILCGSVSSCDEIPLYNVEFISPTALPFQRSCFCSGYWVSI